MQDLAWAAYPDRNKLLANLLRPFQLDLPLKPRTAVFPCFASMFLLFYTNNVFFFDIAVTKQLRARCMGLIPDVLPTKLSVHFDMRNAPFGILSPPVLLPNIANDNVGSMAVKYLVVHR